MTYLQNENIYIILIIIFIIIIVIIFFFSNKERYTNSTMEVNSKYQKSPKMVYDTTTLMDQDYIPPTIIYPPWSANPSSFNKLSGEDSTYMMTHYNQVSKACCSPQFPVPFALDSDVNILNQKKDFALSPYFGNNASQNSGCLCITNKQKDFLVNRGGNTQ
jgi:hypothetical protein